jgi:hypothetical protein
MKFTELERRMIVESLKLGLENDIKYIELVESEGKVPFLTQDYVKELYKDTMEKVGKMTYVKK